MHRRTRLTAVALIASCVVAAPATTYAITPAAPVLSGRPTVINPGDYVCAPSLRMTYLDQHSRGINIKNWSQLDALDAVALPSLYAEKYLGRRGGDFGYRGEFTGMIRQAERQVQRLWNLKPKKVVVVPQKGRTVFHDIPGMTTVIADSQKISTKAARAKALRIRTLIDADPALRHGDNPVLTSGAYTRIPGFMGWKGPYTIIIGDGLLEQYRDQRIMVGVQQVVGHEYSHVQQDLLHRTLPLKRTPEQNRAVELLADAQAAYFVASPRGAHHARTSGEMGNLVKAGGSNGDCEFTWNNHHGTVNQRRSATSFGARLAIDNPRQTMTSQAFMAAFDRKLPDLVKPDAK